MDFQSVAYIGVYITVNNYVSFKGIAVLGLNGHLISPDSLKLLMIEIPNS